MRQRRQRTVLGTATLVAFVAAALLVAIPGAGVSSAKMVGGRMAPMAGVPAPGPGLNGPAGFSAEQKTLEGVVEAVRADAPYPYIDVKVTAGGGDQLQTVRVPLGPAWRLEQIGLKPEAGQEVKLTGYLFAANNVFAAVTVEVGGKSFTLRPNAPAAGWQGKVPMKGHGMFFGGSKEHGPMFGVMGMMGFMGRPDGFMGRPDVRGRVGFDRNRAGFDRDRALKIAATQQKTLAGTITAVKLDAPQPYLELKDAEGKTAKVYVGPGWLLAQLGVKFAVGDDVKLSVVERNGDYRALSVEIGGHLFTLIPGGKQW